MRVHQRQGYPSGGQALHQAPAHNYAHPHLAPAHNYAHPNLAPAVADQIRLFYWVFFITRSICWGAPFFTFTIVHNLKGQSNEIFDLQFFSSFKPVWVTDQWVKIFSILVEISLRYSNFSVEKSDSPGYHTPPGD